MRGAGLAEAEREEQVGAVFGRVLGAAAPAGSLERQAGGRGGWAGGRGRSNEQTMKFWQAITI